MGSSPNKDLPLEGRWLFQHFYPHDKCSELNPTFSENGNDMLFRFHPHFSTKEQPRYNRFLGGGVMSHRSDATLWDTDKGHVYFTKKGSDPGGSSTKLEKCVYTRPYLFDHEHSTLLLGTDHPECFAVWR